MRLRQAKKIVLWSGGGYVSWDGCVVRAFVRFAKAMRKGSRLVRASLPELKHWSAVDRKACGLQPCCNCGTGRVGHMFGDPGCENHDHHCEWCHEKGLCTAEPCADGRTPAEICANFYRLKDLAA